MAKAICKVVCKDSKNKPVCTAACKKTIAVIREQAKEAKMNLPKVSKPKKKTWAEETMAMMTGAGLGEQPLGV